MDPKFEQERLRLSILLLHTGGQVYQAVDLLFATLIPIRSHQKGVFHIFICLRRDIACHLIPVCLRLLAVD